MRKLTVDENNSNTEARLSKEIEKLKKKKERKNSTRMKKFY